MGTIKDRKGKDIREAEEIKKIWQEYTEKLYKKLTWMTTVVWFSLTKSQTSGIVQSNGP